MAKDNFISHDENDDGIDRAGFLKCMAWAGTGLFCVMSGGILKSYGMSQLFDKTSGRLKEGLQIPKGDFSFIQISDSHIGFNKQANPDVTSPLQADITKINPMHGPVSCMLHTRAVPYLSKLPEFDT